MCTFVKQVANEFGSQAELSPKHELRGKNNVKYSFEYSILSHLKNGKPFDMTRGSCIVKINGHLITWTGKQLQEETESED